MDNTEFTASLNQSKVYPFQFPQAAAGGTGTLLAC